ncbi:MAG TPA: tetratricopeptide repeat protein [Polyangia bacterium]|nr:tetratricopeptide repeat protein [Polyangia bacterium]
MAGIASPARSYAQAPPANEAGKARFDQGVKQYNLGRFPEAIAEFEKAYDLDPAPILLFNIAQSHRQLGNKEKALFFYRRYLEQAPDAPNRQNVEQRMKDLAASLEQEKELKQRPPTEVARNTEGAGLETAPPPLSPPPAAVVTSPGPVPAPPSATPATRSWTVVACAGPAFASVSGPSVDLPVLFGARAGARYAFALPSARLTVGLDGVIAVLPYQAIGSTTKTNSSLPGVLARAEYLHDVAPRLSVGAGVGAGVTWWSGLGDGNPFADPNVMITGAIPMPTFQGGLRATFDLLPDVYAVLAPELTYSIPTKGLDSSVSSLVRIDVDVGVGYRF